MVSWGELAGLGTKGGLNIIALDNWGTFINLKLLWNLCGKSDSLWIKWLHCYYVKKDDIIMVRVKSNCSWILRSIMKSREITTQSQVWNRMLQQVSSKTQVMYRELQETKPNVHQKNIFFNNFARPKAKFILWVACHNRLVMKDRLRRFALIDNYVYGFCSEKESI